MSVVKEIKSAGILPFAVLKKRVFFLLGKEVFEPGYADSDRWGSFGGSLEEGESVEEGAAREFYEETAGVVMELAEVRQQLSETRYALYSDLHPEHHSSFRVYLMPVPYRDYPSMFRRTKHFIQYIKGDIKVIEKSQLRWFTLQEVQDTVFHRWGEDRYTRKPKFRAKFAETMRRLFDSCDLQQCCVRAAVTYNCKNHGVRR